MSVALEKRQAELTCTQTTYEVDNTIPSLINASLERFVRTNQEAAYAGG
jgi:hypothetical protein